MGLSRSVLSVVGWMIMLALPQHVSADQGTTPVDDPAAKAFLDHIEAMRRAVGQMQDVTFTFHKQERVGGSLLPKEEAQVKFRPPNDVYMRFPKANREVLFRPGWNDDRLRVKPGRWMPTVNLHPESRLVMRTNRNTIHDIGFPSIIDKFHQDAQRILGEPERLAPQVRDLGEREVFGEPARCFGATLRKDLEPAFYAHRVELCVHHRTNLPARIRAWEMKNGEEKLVEDYGYEDVQVNVGLTDRDFDPDHPDYNF